MIHRFNVVKLGAQGMLVKLKTWNCDKMDVVPPSTQSRQLKGDRVKIPCLGIRQWQGMPNIIDNLSYILLNFDCMIHPFGLQ